MFEAHPPPHPIPPHPLIPWNFEVHVVTVHVQYSVVNKIEIVNFKLVQKLFKFLMCKCIIMVTVHITDHSTKSALMLLYTVN